jgi:hypothetical protein
MRRIGILLAVLALIVGAAGCDYIPRYELYISSTEGGSVIVPGEGTSGLYGDARKVKLVAKPDEGYEFDRWTGDVKHIDDVRAANTTITMWDDYSIKANFKKSPPPINWPLIGGIIAAAVVIGAGLVVFFVRRRRKYSTGKEVVPVESDNGTEGLADTGGISMKQDLAEPERKPIRMGFGSKFRGFVRNPAATFGEVREETLGGALKYTLICLVIFGAATGLVSSLPFSLTGVAMWEIWFGGASDPLGSILGGALSWIPITVGFSVIGGLLFIFIGGAWIHLWVYLLGERKSHGYRQTVKALAYGVTPMCVVGWVPLIGGLAGGIWALVVAIIGLRELHGMTTGKAVAAYLLPAAITFIVIVIVVVRLFLEIVGFFW